MYVTVSFSFLVTQAFCLLASLACLCLFLKVFIPHLFPPFLTSFSTRVSESVLVGGDRPIGGAVTLLSRPAADVSSGCLTSALQLIWTWATTTNSISRAKVWQTLLGQHAQGLLRAILGGHGTARL